MLNLKMVLENNKEELEIIFNFILFAELSDKGFSHNGVTITNPFMDECGVEDVDPIEYYGESFTKSKMAEIIIDYFGEDNKHLVKPQMKY